MSAITIEEELYQAMVDESKKIGTFGHGFTYTAHPVGCAVALKTLEIYQREKIVEHVRKVAPVFKTRLDKLAEHPLVGEARGVGLIGALELVADKKTKRAFDSKKMVGATCVNFLQELGLINRAMGDSVAFCPPLIITTEEIHEMFDMVEVALNQTEEWVRIGKPASPVKQRDCGEVAGGGGGNKAVPDGIVEFQAFPDVKNDTGGI